MGTELYRHHVFTNRCFDELNLTDPQLIEQVLTDYRNAGRPNVLGRNPSVRSSADSRRGLFPDLFG